MTRRTPSRRWSVPRQLSILVAFALLFAAVGTAQVNRVILRVNDEIATLYDYEMLRNEQLAALMRSDLPDERKQELVARVGEDTMRQLFEEMLLVSRADQLGVRVPPEAVDDAMRSTMAGFGLDSVEEFAAGLEQSGMTLERWRDQMRRNLLVREVMGREIQDRVELEEEDLRRYYRANSEEFRRPRRVKLREIVVLEEGGRDEAGRQELADELVAMVRAGEPVDDRLQELAASEQTTRWIELGWVLADDLDPRLAEVVAALGAGEVSEPTLARGGLHLLQALEVEESRIEEFQDVRDRIEQKERERLFSQEAQRYLEELVANSYIDSRPPPEAAGFRPLEGLGATSEEASAGG